MKRRLFISGYLGYYNLGDDLMLELFNRDHFQEYEIIVLSHLKYYKSDFRFINRFNFLCYFFLMRKNDVLVNLGGLFQDKTTKRSFFYYLLINILCILKRGKISLINTDFSDNKSLKFCIGFLLKRSIFTLLRSKNEYKLYKNIYKNIYYSPDIVMLYPFKKINKSKIDHTLVSVRYSGNIHEFIQDLKMKYKSVKFIIMRNEYKFKLLKDIIGKKSIIVYNYFNKEKVFNLIFNSKKVISMRYHIAILGLLWKKEVAIISNNNKMNILHDDYRIPYENRKKNIDKLIKRGYINSLAEITGWSNLAEKFKKKVDNL